MDNSICATCEKRLDCSINDDDVLIDDITGEIVDCRQYKKRKQKYLIAAYNADDVSLIHQMYTYELPEEIKKAINYKDEKVKKRTKFVKPTLDELQAYIKEKNLNVDPEAFIDFYNSKGWKIGKNSMKDWKAACRTWHRRVKNSTRQPQKPGSITSAPTYDIRKIAADARNNTEIKY